MEQYISSCELASTGKMMKGLEDFTEIRNHRQRKIKQHRS